MTLWPDGRLLDLLQVEHPIIQAPMAGSTTPALAAAVSNAGGLGSLGCAMMDPGTVRSTVTALRERTNRSFNVNFFCHDPPGHDPARNARAAALLQPFFDELGLGAVPAVEASNVPFDAAMLETVLELRPRVVSFHFGLPAPELVRPLRDAGMVIISSATGAREARQLEDMGVHAVVAQGFEAGGHRGHFSTSYEGGCIGTMALVPQVVDAVTVPVVASGGIMDGRGIVAALALGASAVQMGTAFLVCDESGTPACHKDAVLAAKPHETRITRAFSGRPARGIVNRVMREVGDPAHPERILPYPVQNALTRGMRAEAGRQGHSDYLSLWSGQGGPLGRREPAAATVARLAGEIREALQVVHQGFTM